MKEIAMKENETKSNNMNENTVPADDGADQQSVKCLTVEEYRDLLKQIISPDIRVDVNDEIEVYLDGEIVPQDVINRKISEHYGDSVSRIDVEMYRVTAK